MSRLSETQFRGIVIAVNVLLVIGIMRMRFCYEPELPPKPPKPKGVSIAAAKATAMRADRNQEVYAQYLLRDSREFGVPPTTVAAMAKVLPYRQSRTRYMLMPGKTEVAEFAGLKLRVRTDQVPGSARPHLLLDIENTLDVPLAYRVTTRPSKGTRPCSKKRDLGHNAIAVAPKSIETRTECVYRAGWGLEVERIEVMSLPLLSYYYVSQLLPGSIGIEDRVARGHLPGGGGQPCRTVLSARTQKLLDSGELQWRDLIDFYARHSCKTYEFPNSYLAWQEDAQSTLPAVPGR